MSAAQLLLWNDRQRLTTAGFAARFFDAKASQAAGPSRAAITQARRALNSATPMAPSESCITHTWKIQGSGARITPTTRKPGT